MRSNGFRNWLELEKLKGNFIEAAESDEFPEKVFAYLSAALGVPVKKLEEKQWGSTVLTLTETVNSYPQPKGLPILDSAPKGGKEADWNYDGRDWHYYSHLLADAYGWTLEYIADLEILTAFAHLQEILTDEFLEREFYHSLSEIAYRYNKGTKKSDYVPLKRPYWMRVVISKTIKKVKIKKSLLPVGVGIDASGLPKEYGTAQFIAQVFESKQAEKTEP